jgi:hypothetical protein
MKIGTRYVAKSSHRVGSLVGSVILRSRDIGSAIVSGKTIWFAWGDNFTERQARDCRNLLGLNTVKCGNYAATVIPLEIMERLANVIIWNNPRDKATLSRQIKQKSMLLPKNTTKGNI